MCSVFYDKCYFILSSACRWFKIWTFSVYFTETNSHKRLIIFHSPKDGIYERFFDILDYNFHPPPPHLEYNEI